MQEKKHNDCSENSDLPISKYTHRTSRLREVRVHVFQVSKRNVHLCKNARSGNRANAFTWAMKPKNETIIKNKMKPVEIRAPITTESLTREGCLSSARIAVPAITGAQVLDPHTAVLPLLGRHEPAASCQATCVTSCQGVAGHRMNRGRKESRLFSKEVDNFEWSSFIFSFNSTFRENTRFFLQNF